MTSTSVCRKRQDLQQINRETRDLQDFRQFLLLIITSPSVGDQSDNYLSWTKKMNSECIISFLTEQNENLIKKKKSLNHLIEKVTKKLDFLMENK